MTDLQRFLVSLVDRGMQDAGMTQGQLALRVGVTEKCLSETLNGHKGGSMKLWDKMFKALEIEL